MKPNPTIKSDRITRTFARNGTRIVLRLEPEAWDAIELVATRYGQKWQQWVSRVLDASPDVVNVTGLVRAAAMDALVSRVEEATGRYDPEPACMSHPLLKLVTPVDRATLEQELAGSDDVYAADFGGFVLHAVNRRQGGPALIIENKMIGQLSVVICEDE